MIINASRITLDLYPRPHNHAESGILQILRLTCEVFQDCERPPFDVRVVGHQRLRKEVMFIVMNAWVRPIEERLYMWIAGEYTRCTYL